MINIGPIGYVLKYMSRQHNLYECIRKPLQLLDLVFNLASSQSDASSDSNLAVASFRSEVFGPLKELR